MFTYVLLLQVFCSVFTEIIHFCSLICNTVKTIKSAFVGQCNSSYITGGRLHLHIASKPASFKAFKQRFASFLALTVTHNAFWVGTLNLNKSSRAKQNEKLHRVPLIFSIPSGARGWNYRTLRIHIPCYPEGDYRPSHWQNNTINHCNFIWSFGCCLFMPTE